MAERKRDLRVDACTVIMSKGNYEELEEEVRTHDEPVLDVAPPTFPPFGVQGRVRELTPKALLNGGVAPNVHERSDAMPGVHGAHDWGGDKRDKDDRNVNLTLEYVFVFPRL